MLKFTLSLGDETRTVLSGIAEHYKPEELIGKKLVLITNLEPRKIRGVLSEGMLLSAASKDDKELSLLTIMDDVPDGSYIS